MGTDFNFSVADLASNVFSSKNPVIQAQNKWLATGKPLTTTRSAVGLDTAANQSTFSISEILQGIPMFGDPANALQDAASTLENLLSGFSGLAGAFAHVDSGGKGLLAKGLGLIPGGSALASAAGLSGGGVSSVLATGLGSLVPSDLRAAVGLAQKAVDAAAGGAQAAAAAAGGDGSANGDNSSGGVTDGSLLIKSPNLTFDNTAGGKAAKNEFSSGKLTPNIVKTVSILLQHFAVNIMCAMTNPDGSYTSTTGNRDPKSLHYVGKAVNINRLKDLSNGTVHYIGHDNHNEVLVKALVLLRTMPWIVSGGAVISDIDPGYGASAGIGFWSDPQHSGLNGNLDIGCYDEGTAIPTSDQLPGQYSAAPSGGPGGGPSGVSSSISGVPFIWPVPRGTVVTQEYGHNGHPGIDLGVSTGTVIVAAGDGKVIHVGHVDPNNPHGHTPAPLDGFGNAVKIDHGGGLMTIYGHLERIDVEVGFSMLQGEQLGLSDTTGLSTGPHLHLQFEINCPPDGSPGTHVNPRQHIAGNP